MGAITYPHDFPVAETRGRWDFCFLVRSLEVIPIQVNNVYNVC